MATKQDRSDALSHTSVKRTNKKKKMQLEQKHTTLLKETKKKSPSRRKSGRTQELLTEL